jgi:hypothetical protein
MEVVAAVESSLAGVVDNEESAVCGCEDGWMTLALGGCELHAAEFFECNSFAFCFCFCFANATSLAEAFLYVISSQVECLRRRINVHVCPSHMGPWQVRGYALATRCLGHFACEV